MYTTPFNTAYNDVTRFPNSLNPFGFTNNVGYNPVSTMGSHPYLANSPFIAGPALGATSLAGGIGLGQNNQGLQWTINPLLNQGIGACSAAIPAWNLYHGQPVMVRNNLGQVLTGHIIFDAYGVKLATTQGLFSVINCATNAPITGLHACNLANVTLVPVSFGG